MKNKLVSLALALTTVVCLIPTAQAATVSGCFTKTLQLGTTDAEVTTLQTILKGNATVYPEGLVTGYFGSLTEKAVKAFQTKYGIDSIGIVGPITRAKLNALYCAAASYPAGCTSAVGFSPTTGLSCSAAVSYPAGCTSAVGFSPTTGLSCAGTVVSYPAGCTSAVGFSSTTGLSCSGVVTPVGPSYGTLSVSSYPVSNPQTTLYGGITYETVAAQYKATGSDITVKKIAVGIVKLTPTAFPWQVFTTLSLWEGSTKLAELPVIQANAIENTFAKDYTFNLSGLNWVIPYGQQKVLTLKATTVTNAISTVTDTSWTLSLLTSVVYSDTAGVTYSVAGTSAIASNALSLTTAQKATATITLAADNPYDTNIIGSTTGTTKVDLMKFNLKVADLNATFNSGTGLIVTIGTGSSTLQSYITSIELWDGSTNIAAAAPVWATATSTATSALTWSNINLPVAAGTTKTLTVKVQIAQLPTTYVYATGNYVNVSTGPTLSGIDTNSNVVASTGAATSNKGYLFVKAPTFALVNTSFGSSGPTGYPQSIGNAKITFNVTANGADIYLLSSNAYTAATSTPSAGASMTSGFACTSGASAATVGYRVSQGTTATCELASIIQFTSSSTGAYYQVYPNKFGWGIENSTTTANSQTWGWDNFKTGLTYLSYP